MRKLLFIFLGILLFPSIANACKPCSSGPDYSAHNAKHIVIGTLTEPVLEKEKLRDSMDPGYGYKFKIEVEESLQGDLKEGKEVIVNSSTLPPCRNSLFIPAYSKRYIFFIYDWGENLSVSTQCGTSALEIGVTDLIRIDKGFNGEIQLQTHDYITLDEFKAEYLSKD